MLLIGGTLGVARARAADITISLITLQLPECRCRLQVPGNSALLDCSSLALFQAGVAGGYSSGFLSTEEEF